MKQYHDLIKHVLENGVDVEDRTGIGTRSVFGYQMRFDLNDGFPAVTTKKLAWKSVVGELLWFLEGGTDERRLAELTYGKPREELVGKQTIWTDNLIHQGKNLGYDSIESIGLLGPVYGSMWRNWYSASEQITEVPERKETIDTAKEVIEFADYGDGHKYTGYRFTSKSGRPIKILGLCSNDKYRKTYIAQALDTGELTKILGSNIPKKICLNPLIKGVANNSFRGDKPSYYKKAYKLWIHMIDRCYNKKHLSYRNYGARGVRVSDSWMDFKNFLLDIDKIPGFYEWVKMNNDYELDKDYYCSDIYSKHTCIFLPKKMNLAIANKQVDHHRKIRVFHYDTYKDYLYKTDICNSIDDLTLARISYLLDTGESYNGYSLKYIQASNGHVFRKKVVADQIVNIINQIKNEPESRRIILSAWNPTVIDMQALPPCHCFFQLIVRENKLSGMLTMRSNDAFLGAPFNIASYALLIHILAREVNMQVGELVYSIGDAHIYNNHIEQVREQLTRKEYPLPTLEISEDFVLSKGLTYGFNFNTVNMFTLKNYQCHPTIKAPMAV
jgi:thymidylate synthase